MKGTIASAIVGSMGKWERKEADFYPTPPDVTHALLRFLDLPEGTLVWEPACGDGAMAKVLEEFGFKVESTDLREDSGYGIGGVDFLTGDVPTGTDCEWIITNPPFNISVAFIKRALEVTPNVAMLLKSQYYHAATRLKFFDDFKPRWVLPLTWRPAFLESERGSSPLMDVVWVVWSSGEPFEHPAYRPLPRPWQPKRSPRRTKIKSENSATEYLRALGFSV